MRRARRLSQVSPRGQSWPGNEVSDPRLGASLALPAARGPRAAPTPRRPQTSCYRVMPAFPTAGSLCSDGLEITRQLVYHSSELSYFKSIWMS